MPQGILGGALQTKNSDWNGEEVSECELPECEHRHEYSAAQTGSGVLAGSRVTERTEEVQAINPSRAVAAAVVGGGRGRTAAPRPHRRSSPEKSRRRFASAVCLPATHRHADKCLVTWGYT